MSDFRRDGCSNFYETMDHVNNGHESSLMNNYSFPVKVEVSFTMDQSSTLKEIKQIENQLKISNG